MRPADLCSKYPKLYHMADKRNWESICRHGLLSTTALLDLFEYEGKARYDVESQIRLREVCIRHSTHGEVFVRDQDPMRDRPGGLSLGNYLRGVTPKQWFEFLNKKVFFWADERSLSMMLCATLYWRKSHHVITVDTGELLDRYSDKISLCAINSGSLHNQKLRSLEDFKSIDRYHMNWVKELTVENSVPDILKLAISVDECVCQRVRGEPSRRVPGRVWSR